MILTLGEGQEILIGYADADYAGDLNHRYSISGLMFAVFRGAVVVSAMRQ